MEILKQLGINSTLWIQLAFFFVAFFFLQTFLFKPYTRNLKYRKHKTTGVSDEAARLMAATEHLAMDYEGKIKNQNEKVMEIYSQIKGEGAQQEQKLVAEARAKAEEVLEKAQAQIAQEIQQAQKDIQNQIPQMSRIAAGKLLGREI